MNNLNIVIVGVGGQGTLLASRILGALAKIEQKDVKVSEVHGMSQRGGSVITYVRIGEDVHSPLVEEGEADYVLAFERAEALRALPYLKKGGAVEGERSEPGDPAAKRKGSEPGAAQSGVTGGAVEGERSEPGDPAAKRKGSEPGAAQSGVTGGTMIANDQKILPMPVIIGTAQYPEDALSTLESECDLVALDAQRLAKEAGEARAVNLVLMGVLCKKLGASKENFLAAIRSCVADRFIEANVRAFEAGYMAV